MKVANRGELTREQIDRLRDEAAVAGDLDMVALCEQCFHGTTWDDRASACAEVARVIGDRGDCDCIDCSVAGEPTH